MLRVVEQFFVELFPRSEAHHFDRLAIRISTRQPHQIPRQVDDPNRFSHVEHEEIRATAEGRRVEDQPGGLGNCHEEPGHVGVCDRERLPVLELLTEDRDDAARRPQHVSEANGDVRRPVRAAASATSISPIRLLAPMTLDGRTALSVETNTNRSTPAEMAASSMTIVPADVHVHGVRRVVFHEWNVLVRGGVDDDAGRLLGDQPIHLSPIRDICEMNEHLTAALAPLPASLQLALDEVQGTLCAIDENQSARADRKDLASELRTD